MIFVMIRQVDMSGVFLPASSAQEGNRVRLQRIELCGFKSFDDRQKIYFDQTITGIVGPNGCGKSNVLDAIRWVMGEQSMKSLRGKSRSDVIFNGSEKRNGADYAEVTLVLEDVAPEQRPEGFENEPNIAITRRLEKDGDSYYLINHQPARLKDIRMLFTGTGLGRNSYAMIEQGKVNEFIQSSPEQRRLWIEEAAGISRYKEQRKEAESRMAQTQSHLDRLNDVLKTLSAQRKNLQRQAAKAKKNRELREEIRDLDLYLSAHRYLRIWARQRQLRLQLESLSDNQGDMREQLYSEEIRVQEMDASLKEEAGHLQEQREMLQKRIARLALVEQIQTHLSEDIQRLNTRQEQLQREQQQNTKLTERMATEREDIRKQQHELSAEQGTQDDRLLEADAQLQELQTSVRDAEQAIEAIKSEVIEAATQAATHRNQLQESGRRLTELKQRQQDNTAEHQLTDEQHNTVKKQHEDVTAQLERCVYEREDLQSQEEQRAETQIQLRKDLQDAEKQAREAQEQVAERRARLQSLQEIQAEYRDLNESSRTLLVARDAGKVASPESLLGALANWVAPEEAYEKAVASALGERLQFLVVRDPQVAIECIHFLHKQDAGRTGFVSLQISNSLPRPKLPQHPTVLGHLLEHVGAPASHKALFASLLGRYVLVKKIADTLEIEDCSDDVTFVDLQGDIRDSFGCFVGGKENSSPLGMLQRRRQIKELETQLEELELLWDQKEERRSELQEDLENLVESRQRSREQIQMLVVKETSLKKDLQRLDADTRRFQNQKDILEREATRLLQQIQTLQQEQSVLERRLQESTLRYEQKEESLQQKRTQVDAERQQQQKLIAELTTIKVNIAARNERQESLRQQLEQWEQRQLQLQERQAQSVKELAEVESSLHTKKQGMTEAKTEQQELQTRIDNEEQVVKQQIIRYAEAEQDLAKTRKAVEELRQRVDHLRDMRTNFLLEQRECEVQLEALEHEVRGKYGFSVGETLPGQHCRPVPSAEDDKRLLSLQDQLMKLGEVNPLAEQEFNEIDQQYTFMQEQVDDLEKTMSSLQKTIQKINQKTKEQFGETYEAIRANFQYLFPKLFEGGHADLILTNPNDLLETGIDISVRPPGKRRQNLVLLSGGEKALTTTALIFSFFLYKPAPFCILDEVDAPLDDVNIDRYNKLLRELCSVTQFILITHNKRTMELADQLYGVTMQEPGVSKVLTVRIEEIQDDDIAHAA